MLHSISDWDDAYANGANIANGHRWPDVWVAPAAQYRDDMVDKGRADIGVVYGDKPRNRYDLFRPEGYVRGLVVFIHGGYWLRFDNSLFSHLARGAVERGYAVAMPSYTLCPSIDIPGITREIGAAIMAAAISVDGPICLTGHSAGGHLATRMISSSSPLPASVRNRIRNTVSISGIHDLRPIMMTAMNATLVIDEAQALAESPALLRPLPNMRLTCWAGGAERSEFLRQNALLANIWRGLGARTRMVEEPDRHHLNIVDGLADADHPLVATLLTV